MVLLSEWCRWLSFITSLVLLWLLLLAFVFELIAWWWLACLLVKLLLFVWIELLFIFDDIAKPFGINGLWCGWWCIAKWLWCNNCVGIADWIQRHKYGIGKKHTKMNRNETLNFHFWIVVCAISKIEIYRTNTSYDVWPLLTQSEWLNVNINVKKKKTPESNDYESIDVRNVMISSYGDDNDE